MALVADLTLNSGLSNAPRSARPGSVSHATSSPPFAALPASPSWEACSLRSARRLAATPAESSAPNLASDFFSRRRLPWHTKSALPCQTDHASLCAPRASYALGHAVSDNSEETVDLCIFPMQSIPLPTSTGTLTVFEPQMLALLQVIQHVAAASPQRSAARFGAMPYDWVQRQLALEPPERPPSTSAPFQGSDTASFLAVSAAAGFLQFPDTQVTGCCCLVETVLGEPDETSYFVQHRGVRRIQPVQILRRQPFLVVRCRWVDDCEEQAQDKETDKPCQQASHLEQAVWGKLQEVESLTARLAGRQSSRVSHSHSLLPAAVAKFAPQVQESQPFVVASPWVVPTSQLGQEVSVWRKMKSKPSSTRATPTSGLYQSHRPRGPILGPAAAMSSTATVQTTVPALEPAHNSASEGGDPYLTACEKLTKAARQEAFSFAAATVIDLGPEQRQLLVDMTSTGQRLQWVLKAIEPYLSSLRAECSMRKALGDV